MKDNLKKIESQLSEKGYKFTYQRRVILHSLYYADKHLRAEEIFNQLREKNIGLATVYRTLKLYVELGIAKEIKIDDVNYFELKIYSKKCLHMHFKCINCGKILDIDDQDLCYNYLKSNIELEEKYGVSIKDANLVFEGICKECKEDKNAET
ncbi:Fur family transcriptional regulator [Clostridium sp. DL1XJH146]